MLDSFGSPSKDRCSGYRYYVTKTLIHTFFCLISGTCAPDFGVKLLLGLTWHQDGSPKDPL
jgi:hypothetical protein